MIAIANWHLLAEGDEAQEIEDEEEITAPGAPLAPEQVITAVLPLMPGRAGPQAFSAFFSNSRNLGPL
ncbi:MAG: hypothetical protein ABIR56_03470 [Polaromonas sp.]